MTIDPRNEAERLLNAAMDHIAGTHEQPRDVRAWDHLLTYCPRYRLEIELLRREIRHRVRDAIEPRTAAGSLD